MNLQLIPYLKFGISHTRKPTYIVYKMANGENEKRMFVEEDGRDIVEERKEAETELAEDLEEVGERDFLKIKIAKLEKELEEN